MNQSPKNALHSKFHLVTGDTVTRDEEYEHLQVGSCLPNSITCQVNLVGF